MCILYILFTVLTTGDSSEDPILKRPSTKPKPRLAPKPSGGPSTSPVPILKRTSQVPTTMASVPPATTTTTNKLSGRMSGL